MMNDKPDRIEYIELKYRRTTKIEPPAGARPEEADWEYITWEYGEELVIDRKTETVKYERQIATECKATHTFQVLEGVSDLLDSFCMDDFSVVEVPGDLERDPMEERVYEMTIRSQRGTEKVLKGGFDRFGLPADFGEFIETVANFIRFYLGGEIMDRRIYAGAGHRASDLIFCFVSFEGERTYSYLTDDPAIAAGDYVWVPVGKENHEKIGKVEAVEYHQPEDAPYPLDKIKSVIRKATDDELIAADLIEECREPYKMTIEELREKICHWGGGIEFSYRGIEGGIYPDNRYDIGLAFGEDELYDVCSVEDALSRPFIDGHSLTELIDELWFQ